MFLEAFNFSLLKSVTRIKTTFPGWWLLRYLLAVYLLFLLSRLFSDYFYGVKVADYHVPIVGALPLALTHLPLLF